MEYVINQINRLHKKLQNQEFNIGCLKTEIKLCFESIFKLVCLPEKFETPFKEVIELDWEDASTQSQWFSKDQFLIQNLQNKVHKDFGYLKTTCSKIKESFVNICYQYLGKLFNQMKKYLPFNDEILETSSFIELKDKLPILEDKLTFFNRTFNVISENELKYQAFPQLLRLRDYCFDNFQKGENDSSLDIWKRIEKTGKYPSLVKFFKISQILPVSSSNVEQLYLKLKEEMNNEKSKRYQSKRLYSTKQAEEQVSQEEEKKEEQLPQRLKKLS